MVQVVSFLFVVVAAIDVLHGWLVEIAKKNTYQKTRFVLLYFSLVSSARQQKLSLVEKSTIEFMMPAVFPNISYSLLNRKFV